LDEGLNMRIRTKLMLYTIFAWLSFVKVGTEMIWKFRLLYTILFKHYSYTANLKYHQL
jgi:hypothetical protein